MQSYYFNIILRSSVVLIVFVISACSDVFEKNISQSNVVVIIPQSADTLISNQVHFKWEKLNGASEYELHIVSSAFNNIEKYVLDSLIEENEFKIILEPGYYEYKIRALNSAYQTDFSIPRSFFIDSISDLSAQLVQLSSPQNNLYSNDMNIDLFVWQNLFFADFYTFQIWDGPNFGQNALIHQENSIYAVNYNFNETTAIFLNEGVYSWGVKAVNQTSESAFNSRVFSIDTTAPNDATLSFPLNNYPSVSNQLTLKWTKGGADYGIVQSPVFSNVQISYNDSLFSLGNVTEINNIESDSLQRQFPQSGSYWWRVYLNDAAGNESYYYSNEEKFTIP